MSGGLSANCGASTSDHGAGHAGAASTVERPAGGAAGQLEHGSGAGRAFQPDRRPPHSFTEYRALPRFVAHARAHTRKVLHGWGMSYLTDTAELLVSELFTNAVRASVISDQLMVRLLLRVQGDDLHISAWDSAPGRPEHKRLADDSVSGRGLLLVEALSSDYGSYLSAGTGKVVWCVISSKEPDAR
jgi:anti-sigma regulatory factor (Ser/Thr protein kinase)